ncbi:MAG TPA: flagellar motor switch protein FliG [Stellaceae bacterium]|jgi:flagellar motor switch protein FliG|nr:flagellar motor switch protein FliG [Stellaceae bacterium]
MPEAAPNKTVELNDTEKAAVLLLSIGPEAAAEIIKFMSQPEINLLTQAMTHISKVPQQAVTAVFEEYTDLMLQETSLGLGASAYVSEVLERALGVGEAKRLVGRLKHDEYFAGIEAVQWQEPRVLAELIKSEHPQIIAMILAHLEGEQVDALIRHLPEELVEQVIPRLATLDTIPPTVLRELNEAIEDLLSGDVQQDDRIAIGGVTMAGKILHRIEGPMVERIMAQIQEVDPELAQRIADSMFAFEDLINVDDRNFQVLLRAIDQRLLVSALKGADSAMQSKVMRNLSQRAAEMLRDEIGARGPMRASDVETAKREIIEIARRLESERKIILGAGTEKMVA